MKSLTRFSFSILAGAFLTPLAGYLGAFAFPDLIALWLGGLLFSLFAGFKAAAALLVAPALYGAKIAWPTTCVVFPLATLVLRPVTAWLVFVFSGIGAAAGIATVYVEMIWRILLVSKDQSTFLAAGGFAGLILGSLFGFALWRFDRLYPIAASRRSFG